MLMLELVTSVFAANDPAQIKDVVGIIQNIIGLLAPAAAIALLIMFLVAGYKFVTSGGDPKAVGSARSVLTYAVIGIILVVAAYLILLVIENVTGVTVTKVEIPSQ